MFIFLPKNLIDQDFLVLLGEFLDAGGFAKPCVVEKWERIHRQQATCPHGSGIQACGKCRKSLRELLSRD